MAVSLPTVRERLQPYLPRLTLGWLADEPDALHRSIDGSVVFIDISGFTALSEKLAKLGKVGAEEMADAINTCFAELLQVAYESDGSLLKFGGDALLLLFAGGAPPEHAARATRAAGAMRARLRTVGKLATAGGRVRLQMSVGVHSGTFDVFLVGGSHRELLVTGPAATEVVRMEGAADAGEIVVSPATAALLPTGCVGRPKGAGMLLRSAPAGFSVAPSWILPELDDDVLRASVPLAVRETLLAGIAEPEHRQASIAFVHFEGIDEMLREHGPASVATELDRLVRDTQAAVDEHEVAFLGSDVDADGGKLILAAGVPRSIGDDEERMLLALRRIVRDERAIPIRIGVNQGNVFAGDIGPPYRRTFTVMGDTVNLAARLMARSPRGEIYATASVLDHSSTDFSAVALEPFEVKGKAQPIHAWSVGEPTGSRAGRVEGEVLPFVGRASVFDELMDALIAARTGRVTMVEIVGEAGIGKSRLADELREHAADLTHVRSTGEAYTSAWPYVAWRGILRDALGASWDDPPEVVVAHLRRHASAHDPGLEPWLPLVASVLDVEMEPTREVSDLAEAFVRPKLHEVMHRFLRTLLPQQVMLTFEDAHLMDEASAALLSSLAAMAEPDRPWLILVLHRDQDRVFAPAGEAVHRIEPGPLHDDALLELARAATDEHPLAPDVLERAVEIAGGNPQFLLDLVRSAGEGGELPESVEAAAIVQIDALPPADRALLRRASVLGLAFHPRFLDDVLDDDIPRPDAQTWERLRRFLEAEADGYHRFRRTAIRDAAYASLPFKTRRRLHEVVGERYERESTDPDEIAGLLSLHFFHAERYDETWRYSRTAGAKAWGKAAVVEALDHYEKALVAARRLESLDPSEVAEVHRSVAEANSRLGRFDAATEAFRAARRLVAGDPMAEATLLLAESWMPERHGKYPLAVRTASRARRALEGMHDADADALRAQIIAVSGTYRYFQGKAGQAIDLSTEALGIAERVDAREAIAQAQLTLSLAYADLGELRAAEEWSDRALAIAEELRMLSGQGQLWMNKGTFAYYEGRWNEAVTCWERGAELRLATGDRVEAANATNNIAEVLSDQGRWAEAEAMFRDALHVWRAAEVDVLVAFATGNLGRVAARTGRIAEALGYLEQARAGFEAAGYASLVTETDARLAEVYVFDGRSADALDLVDRLIQADAEADGASAQGPMLLRLRGYALLQQGHTDAARDSFDASLGLARERGADHEVAFTLAACWDLAAAEGLEPDPALETERAELFAKLGIVSEPAIPARDRGLAPAT
jgi:class 3 adenylate cyclase/predicted ATPase